MNNNSKTNRSVFPDGSTFAEKTELQGTVKVHESVIASIIRKTACSVPGVIRIAGNSLVNNLAEMVGSRKVMDRSIMLEMGDNSVSVRVELIFAYGVYLPDVAKMVQENIASEIHRITGMNVPKIEIVIADLEEEQPQEKTEEADED